MHRHRTRLSIPRENRGAWLSLFAMLMIFAGPLLSQSMPMEHHASMAMPASAPMTGQMTAGEHAHHASDQSSEASGPGISDHALWAKCGYCTLLFSCPALPSVMSLAAAALPKPVDVFAAVARQGHARQAIFPNARSRAPPALRTAGLQ
jgi:hypothetical protein